MVEQSKYKFIYGPVSSWRLGKSLGIDPISSTQKTCTFNCVYCQVGLTESFPTEREIFVSTEELMNEIRSLSEMDLDYITFAGNGEPTLAKNLGEMIRAVKIFRKEKVAVITNASLIDRPDVQEDLLLADLVEAKLDAYSGDSLQKVSRPAPEILWENIVIGLKSFRQAYRGRLVLQIMFVGLNRAHAAEMAKLACEINPDEIEINTPLRVSLVRPLLAGDLEGITKIFRDICGTRIKVRSIYEEKREKSTPMSEGDTQRRRGTENF